MLLRFYWIIFLCAFKHCVSFFDPISMVIGGAVLGGLGYNYKYLKDKTFCKYYECCTDEYIKLKINDLNRELITNIYGQHIVISTLITALKSHYDNLENSKKPLVITFHGTTGTGKNYAADFIVKSIFKNGVKSGYVHKFIGRLHFTENRLIDEYRSTIKKKIISTVQNCPKSVFIFDEIDKMPPGILESITPFLDHHNTVDGINFRQAVFIFISNTGGAQIADQLKIMYRKGITRGGTSLKDFEYICHLAAFNVMGGLQKSGAIEASLIDHYIPFLPLERSHVEDCIKAEFKRLHRSCSSNDIEYILKEIAVEDTAFFVPSGCKRISKKVEARIEMNESNDSWG